MPLAEEVDRFVISEKLLKPEKEESYHAGTIYIDVINQDAKLPRWFRQSHPFVFAGDGVVAFAGKDDRYGIQLAISGARFRREEYQGISLEMPKATMVRLMNRIKDVLDQQETFQKFKKETEAPKP